MINHDMGFRNLRKTHPTSSQIPSKIDSTIIKLFWFVDLWFFWLTFDFLFVWFLQFTASVNNSISGSLIWRSILWGMLMWSIRTILVSGQILFWYGKSLPKIYVLEKLTFWDYRENELIHWRYIFKSSPMLGSTRRGFYFGKINISKFLRHAHFEEIALLLIFGHSGDSQKAF